MHAYSFSLFGRFNACCNDSELRELERGKAQDILCYLLLHRREAHNREDLAARFWPESTTAQSRKYLRQAIWQIQKALDAASGGGPRLVLVQPDWVRLNPDVPFWMDIEAFEEAFEQVRQVPGAALDERQTQVLKDAVDLYKGPLLQGWYSDWCTLERDRLEGIYLQMLDKLMDLCEATREYDEGLSYGTRVLRYERAREVTHFRMIRLFYLAGDRTAALNQYQRCSLILREDLGVQPSARTLELIDLVRTDRLERFAIEFDQPTLLQGTLERLRQVRSTLSSLYEVVEGEISQLERHADPLHHLFPGDNGNGRQRLIS